MNLLSQRDYCVQHWSNGNTTVMVADRSNVKQLSLSSGEVSTVPVDVQNAFDVDLNGNGSLAITDMGGPVITFYKPRESPTDDPVVEEILGSSLRENTDGPHNYARFDDVAGFSLTFEY